MNRIVKLPKSYGFSYNTFITGGWNNIFSNTVSYCTPLNKMYVYDLRCDTRLIFVHAKTLSGIVTYSAYL